MTYHLDTFGRMVYAWKPIKCSLTSVPPSFNNRVDPLVNPPPTYPKPSSYRCNGLSVALPCPLDGVTNRFKVYVKSRVPPPPRRLYFLSPGIVLISMFSLCSHHYPTLGLRYGTYRLGGLALVPMPPGEHSGALLQLWVSTPPVSPARTAPAPSADAYPAR